jgi:hypothetical protein
VRLLTDWTFWIAPGLTVIVACWVGAVHARNVKRRNSSLAQMVKSWDAWPTDIAPDEAERRLKAISDCYQEHGLKGLVERHKDLY